MGLWKILTDPTKVDPSVITMAWAVLNCVLLFACLGVMIERRQRRTTPRIPADYPVTLEMGGQTMMGRFGDLSNTGAGIWVSGTQIPRNLDWKQELSMVSKGDYQNREFHLSGVVRNYRELGDGMWVGVEFTPQNDQQFADQVVLVNGSSRRWRRFQLSREVQRGIISSFFFVLFYGLKFSLEHLGYLLLYRSKREEPKGNGLSREQKAKAFYDSSQKVYRVDSSGAETNSTLEG